MNSKCSDAEFIELWERLQSPQRVADAIGIAVRNVMTRRRTIETRYHLKLVAGFFIACLPLSADSTSYFTVTEAKPTLCPWEIDGKRVMVSCAYITHLFVRAKRGCPECAWKQKAI